MVVARSSRSRIVVVSNHRQRSQTDDIASVCDSRMTSADDIYASRVCISLISAQRRVESFFFKGRVDMRGTTTIEFRQFFANKTKLLGFSYTVKEQQEN